MRAPQQCYQGRQLNVLSVCRALPTPQDPSAGVFVQNRLAALARVANVRVAQPLPWFPVVAPFPAWARQPSRESQGMNIQHAPMFYVPRFLKSLDAYWLERSVRQTARRLYDQGALDLIDAHFGYPEGVGCLNLARKLGLPVFITIRGFETEYLRKPIIGPMLARALREATAIISVSHSLRDLAIRSGVNESKVRVIHNAIDRDIFRPGDMQSARHRLDLPLQDRIIVSVGHLISRKRHHVLIDAFCRVRERNPKALLVIIGGRSFEPEYPERLHRQVRAAGAESVVRFLGNASPRIVADWLQAADVFALGTAREGCCNAVLEALAAGVPVVTTPVGDNACFVREGENGYLAPVDNVEAMGRALDVALTRRDWPRAQISEQLGVGSWIDVAQRVEAYFRETLSVERTSGAASVLSAVP